MQADDRPTPEALLAAIRKDEAKQGRGALKVFLGMAPGVGKTFALLEAARRELATGRDVVIGYVETHGRAETDALVEGLPLVPRRSVEYRGVRLGEMDLDAVLARRPQLALVDELAHTNVPGSRHPKRWQDVRELLDAGINVFTTLNVQHVESRAELVREITGATMQETVPDSVLDQAEFELVDLPPDELLRRLAEGKVYLPDRARAAAGSFFREGNLMALREIALRLAAEHAGQDVREFLAASQMPGAWKTGHRLLTAISPSPLSEPLARWTRQLADNLGAPWLAVFVDTGRPLADAAQARLQKNLALARELGAEIITTTGEDIVGGILRVARQHNVTQIVVGKPAGFHVFDLFRGGSMLNRLIRESGNIDVHCVRAAAAAVSGPALRFSEAAAPAWKQYGIAALAVLAVTLLGFAVRAFTGYSSVSLLYLLTVVLLAMFIGRGPILFAAAAGALLWNFLFLPPLYTLHITKLEDALMFGMFFLVALTMGQLTARIRAQAVAERGLEQRATALYLLTRSLAESKDPAELLAVAVRLLGETFHADVALLLPASEGGGELIAYPFGTLALTKKEEGVADWAFRNAKPAGRGSDTLASAESLFVPLVTPGGCIGVAGLRFHQDRMLSVPESNLLDGFGRQIALVLDRARLRDAETGAALLAESERLGRTLLNSVSHELKTPLAALRAATDGLERAGGASPAYLGELRAALQRLHRLVNNLLDMTRLEAGAVRPRADWCDVRELCDAALEFAGDALAQHPVRRDVPEELPMVKLDQTLTEQALANLLLNAAAHTPAGTDVTLEARVAEGLLTVAVLDRGPGLPSGAVEELFRKFTRGANAPAGGSGLGLAIARGFARAQGGEVTAANRADGGAAFTLRLPVEVLTVQPETTSP